MIHRIYNLYNRSRKDKFIDTESRSMIAKPGGRSEDELQMGKRELFRGMEIV